MAVNSSMIMYSDDILSRISRVKAVTLDYSVCFLVHVTLKNRKKSQPAYIRNDSIYEDATSVKELCIRTRTKCEFSGQIVLESGCRKSCVTKLLTWVWSVRQIAYICSLYSMVGEPLIQ